MQDDLTSLVGGYLYLFARVETAIGVSRPGYRLGFDIYDGHNWKRLGVSDTTRSGSIQVPIHERFKAGRYEWRVTSKINGKHSEAHAHLTIFHGNIDLKSVSYGYASGRFQYKYQALDSTGAPVIGRTFSVTTNEGNWSGVSGPKGNFTVSIRATKPPTFYQLKFAGDDYYSPVTQ